jgi:hypothetical protein
MAEAARLAPKNAMFARDWREFKEMKHEAEHPFLLGR